jgi:hypothetical protein
VKLVKRDVGKDKRIRDRRGAVSRIERGVDKVLERKGTTASKKHLVLSCTCGDCVHWEIFKEHTDADLHILCRACGKECHGKNLDSIPTIVWVERDAI